MEEIKQSHLMTRIEVDGGFSVIRQNILDTAIEYLQSGMSMKYEDIAGRKAPVFTIPYAKIIKSAEKKVNRELANEHIKKFADATVSFEVKDENGNSVFRRMHLFRGLEVKAVDNPDEFTLILDDYFLPYVLNIRHGYMMFKKQVSFSLSTPLAKYLYQRGCENARHYHFIDDEISHVLNRGGLRGGNDKKTKQDIKDILQGKDISQKTTDNKRLKQLINKAISEVNAKEPFFRLGEVEFYRKAPVAPGTRRPEADHIRIPIYNTDGSQFALKVIDDKDETLYNNYICEILTYADFTKNTILNIYSLLETRKAVKDAAIKLMRVCEPIKADIEDTKKAERLTKPYLRNTIKKILREDFDLKIL